MYVFYPILSILSFIHTHLLDTYEHFNGNHSYFKFCLPYLTCTAKMPTIGLLELDEKYVSKMKNARYLFSIIQIVRPKSLA